jgi:hypothetical protein
MHNFIWEGCDLWKKGVEIHVCLCFCKNSAYGNESSDFAKILQYVSVIHLLNSNNYLCSNITWSNFNSVKRGHSHLRSTRSENDAKAHGLPTYAGQHRQNRRRHSCLEWDSKPRSQCSSGRRHFMPHPARPLWSAIHALASPENSNRM